AQKKVYLVYTEDSGCRAFVPHGSYNSRPLCPGGSAGASGDMLMTAEPPTGKMGTVGLVSDTFQFYVEASGGRQSLSPPSSPKRLLRKVRLSDEAMPRVFVREGRKLGNGISGEARMSNCVMVCQAPAGFGEFGRYDVIRYVRRRSALQSAQVGTHKWTSADRRGRPDSIWYEQNE
ncbi:unnamed protein product, partial [Cladocopium goreaui]